MTAAQTEYYILTTAFIFISLLILLFGYFGINEKQKVENINAESIGILEGTKYFLTKPYDESAGISDFLYYLVIIGPFTIILALAGTNLLRGRS